MLMCLICAPWRFLINELLKETLKDKNNIKFNKLPNIETESKLSYDRLKRVSTCIVKMCDG